MAKFILPYNISSTLQSLRDSPRWGYWGPYSPDPLRRSALRALFLLPPSHYVTAPGGGTGDRIPQPPCVAPLRWVCSGFVLGSFVLVYSFIKIKGFWWLLVVTAFLPILSIVTRLFSITSNFCLSPIFLRRDKNGTKPENIISKNTFEPIKSFAEHCFAAAKVLFCPVKNEGKSINLLFCGVFVDLCGTKDNTNAIFNRFF